jgi:hypothetical protein
MEILELREELHAASARRDDVRVAALSAAMERRRADLLATIDAGFATLGDGDEAGAVRALGQKLAVMRYVARFLDEVTAYEETRYQEGA